MGYVVKVLIRQDEEWRDYSGIIHARRDDAMKEYAKAEHEDTVLYVKLKHC